MSSAVRIRTLRDLAEAGHWLTICCDRETPRCHHSAHVDVRWLVQRAGRDYPCDAASIQRIGSKCTECGCSKVTVRSAARGKFEIEADEDLPF